MNLFLMTSMADRLTFGSPGWFWALLLLAPLIWFYVDAARRREALLARIVAPRLQKQLTGQVSQLKRNLRTGFLLGAVLLNVVALAKPRYGFREETVTTKGRDVILAVDVSRSMLATDTAPTRLGRAKLISQDLLDLLRGDRVGLIAFAGSAFLQAPLTMDKGAVLTSIRDLDSNTIPKGGTDIASAIRMAIAAFGKGEGATRALVLMTDGEDLEQSALEAAKQAEAAGIRIFTIGFGSANGSLIPIRTEEGRNDFVRDESGNPVNSKLDVSRLTEIAQSTGGFYLPYGQDAAKVIFEKGILPLEEQVGGTLTGRKPIERYAWPVAAALLLLALRSVLGEGRRLPKVSASAALLLLLAVAPLHASGLNDYRQGNYQGALQDFEKRLKAGDSMPEIKFDAGAAAYKAGDFQKAAGYFSEAMTSPKPKIRDAATYNLANSLVRSGEAAKENDAKLSDWKNALQHYETVIKADPANARAKENRDIVKKLIEDLKKQQQQKNQNKDQKDQKDQKNNKDNKDQNKNDQSQGGGNGQKDSKENKDSKDKKDSKDQKGQQGDGKDQQNKDQQKNPEQKDQKNPNDKNDQKGGEDQKQNEPSQGQGSPTPTPTPSPDQGKGGDSKDQKNDHKEGKDQQDQQSRQPQNGQQGNQQQQSGSQGGQPTPTSSPTPAKQGSLGGGQKGEKKEQQPAEAAEAEESKDGGMTPSQARALLNSLKDEEAHVSEQQKNRAVEQPLRDW
jgi:Ca-activated chloride channel family protein